MQDYQIEIRATIKARNLDSAQGKRERLLRKIEPVADWTEVRMRGDHPHHKLEKVA